MYRINEDCKELGEFIRKRRRYFGMSQNYLATRCGISRTEIVRIESGQRKQPSLTNLKKISENLYVPFDKLKSLAKYESKEGENALSFYYPALKTEKQISSIESIIEIITTNNLSDKALDDIVYQAKLQALAAKYTNL